MSIRRLPVRPDRDQLTHQAKDLRKAIRAGDPTAALSWGQRFHNKIFVSEPAMRLIEERGGRV